MLGVCLRIGRLIAKRGKSPVVYAIIDGKKKKKDGLQVYSGGGVHLEGHQHLVSPCSIRHSEACGTMSMVLPLYNRNRPIPFLFVFFRARDNIEASGHHQGMISDTDTDWSRGARLGGSIVRSVRSVRSVLIECIRAESRSSTTKVGSGSGRCWRLTAEPEGRKLG